MDPFEVLVETPGLPAVELPAKLARLYGGGLGFESRRLYANFVTSLDGVVALEPPGTGSGTILSGRNEPDRFLMGLLRALADAVLVGAATWRAEPEHRWTPEAVFPSAAAEFAELRTRLGKPAEPRLVVLPSGRADLTQLVHQLRDQGCQLILSEGGPHALGGLLGSGLVDELFLTVSPVLAGRSESERLGLVHGLELLPDKGIWAQLLSLRRHGSHLFARYVLQ